MLFSKRSNLRKVTQGQSSVYQLRFHTETECRVSVDRFLASDAEFAARAFVRLELGAGFDVEAANQKETVNFASAQTST